MKSDKFINSIIVRLNEQGMDQSQLEDPRFYLHFTKCRWILLSYDKSKRIHLLNPKKYRMPKV